ncbi:MAG: NusA-like transcription termination signal-binding factor [Candidatus Micrarchaeota archaeon]
MPTISNDELALLNTLERSTGAKANDVFATNECVTFIVQQGDLGKAIGKQGANLEHLRRAFGKNVDLVEDAETLRAFLANVFRGVEFLSVEEKEDAASGRKIVFLKVSAEHRGKAIGRGGEKINRARALVKRKFGCDDVKIS